MHKKLQEILAYTKIDLIKRKKQNRLFSSAIKNPKKSTLSIIAEIKLASPTEKTLGSYKEISARVKEYEKSGADAISVVTEKHFFKGDPSFVKEIKNTVTLPVLQKDFIVDPYQIYEAKLSGADALLLIAKIVSKKDLISLVKLTMELGIEPVVEINSNSDLKKALATQTNIIAVNARDLDTFRVDVDKACKLIKKVPDKFTKLGFSGVQSRMEVEKYKHAGAKGVLVGMALMKTDNIAGFLRDLKTSVKVKICGVRTIGAARSAVDAGADFLGFNFVPTSKRYINPADAAKIINKIKGRVKTIGVFQNADVEYVNTVSSNLGLDFVQFHGNENNVYIGQIKKPVIKAIQTNTGPKKIKAEYFLLDRINRKGPMVDLKKAAQLAEIFPIFLAGGLSPDNVAEVIRKVKPFAVDVAGGVETNGHQDLEKIKLFIKNAKEAR